MSGRISKAETLAALPPPWAEDLRTQTRAAVCACPEHKVVVIDDDPTGTRTVYDVPILMTWDVATLRKEFAGPEPCFYLLTNSRSMPAEVARAVMLEVAENLQAAAGGRAFTLVSRSDSALRGHFPLETDVLAEVLGHFDATILVPYCEQGGRYTINDTQYLSKGEELIPIAETPFAHDPVFGYRHSHLPTFVAEKTGGRVKAGDVHGIALGELRRDGPVAVARRLLDLPRRSVVVVNAVAPQDLDVFAAGLLVAEIMGRRYCLRTAADFPAARLGLVDRPLLTVCELDLTDNRSKRTLPPASGRGAAPSASLLRATEPHRKPVTIPEAESDREPGPVALPNAGGLILAGSTVPTTMRQLARLPSDPGPLRVELRLERLLSARHREHVGHALAVINRALLLGQDVVVSAGRPTSGGNTRVQSGPAVGRLSQAWVDLLRGLEVRPRYLLIKGGLTASELAIQALGVKRVQALGQLLPGVPVWRLGLEARFPGLIYVVFPGNVGEPDALGRAWQLLNGR